MCKMTLCIKKKNNIIFYIYSYLFVIIPIFAVKVLTVHFFASFEIHNTYYFMFSLVYIHALMHTKNVWISSNFIRILFSKNFRLFEVIRITFFIAQNKYEIIYRKILTTLRCRNKFCFNDSLDLYIIFVIRMYSEFFLVTFVNCFFK